MGVYVGGAVTVHAKLKSRKDWELFDEQKDALTEIASKYGVFVDRNSINDGDDIAFVVFNQKPEYISLYAGEFVENSLQVAVDDAFASKADAFIAEINQSASVPDQFKELAWSDVAIRHYVIS